MANLGLADITAACAFGFIHSLPADVIDTAGIRISRRSPRAPKRFPHFAPPAGGWRDPLHDRRLTKREPLREQSGRN